MDDWQPVRLRRLPLSCYDNVVLMEAQIGNGDVLEGGKQPRVVTFLLHDRGLTMLNDSWGMNHRLTILEFNRWKPPQLGTSEQAGTYLKLMMGLSSRVLDGATSLDWAWYADSVVRGHLERMIHPPTLVMMGGTWVGEAVFQWQNGVSRIAFTLAPDGGFNITDEQSLGRDLPIKMRHYYLGARYDSW